MPAALGKESAIFGDVKTLHICEEEFFFQFEIFEMQYFDLARCSRDQQVSLMVNNEGHSIGC